MARRSQSEPEIAPKVFLNADEIDQAITKLQRRVHEIAELDFVTIENDHSGADDVARSNLRNAILEVFGPNSPEYREHRHIDFWAAFY
jgi:hypothetical protein